jgi:TM2 domain-containing membrane protein YozV
MSESMASTEAGITDQPSTGNVEQTGQTQAPTVAKKFCSECGMVIAASARACPHCGAQLSGGSTTNGAGRDKTAAALIALFLGGIGGHKFYLGKPGMGILYLVFCWTLIPALIALVEAIQLFSMSQNEFNMKYN